MQLIVGVRRAGLEMQVVHPIELLDRAYRSSNVSRSFPETTKVVTTINKVVTTNKKEK
jgi:hypothetical protein